jgi:ectoine hydroxylase-related dioxygenase (phytanoyl-CoA dioxygenase family)
MRQELTQSEIARYRRDGFLAIDDLLTIRELDIWRESVDEAVAMRGDQTHATGDRVRAGGDADYWEFYERVFTQKTNLWQSHAGVRKLVLDSRLGGMAAALEGIRGVRVWHDQALIKEPYGNPTAYHVDVAYWSFTSANATSIWVALDDTTLANGCLYFVPGSHKTARFEAVEIGADLGGIFKRFGDPAEAPVPCPIPAGGCTFHNGLTIHGAGANMTSGRRRAMACIYMPDGATFNGKANILPPEYLERITVGDHLNNDEINPLVFSRE